MARRTLNHKALRADFEAAERKKKEAAGETVDQTDEVEDSGDEGEVEAADDATVAPAKKKRKAAAPKTPRPKRTRTVKVVRQRVVWGVFNNSNARVQTFAYPQKTEAEEYAAKMRADKGTMFFVQPVKEPIEEPKE